MVVIAKRVQVQPAEIGEKSPRREERTGPRFCYRKFGGQTPFLDVDILKVLESAKQIVPCPDDIVIFGMNRSASPMQMHLNEPIQAQIPDYIAEIKKELTR